MLYSQLAGMMMRSDAPHTLQQEPEHVNGPRRSFWTSMTAIPLAYPLSRYEHTLPCDP